MKNELFSLALILGLALPAFSQVGIGTNDPKATLDINGNLKVRTVPEVTTVTDDYFILMQNNSSAGDTEIIRISSDNFASPAASTAYAAESDGGWSLLDLGISGTNWNRLNLSSGDTTIGDPTHFVNGTYTAPSSGVYIVNYELQLEAGVDLTLLGEHRLGLLRNGTVIEDKVFDGIRIALGSIPIATIPITSTNVNKMVMLQDGDELTFAVETGGVNLNLLTDSRISLNIYKISN